MKCLTYVAAVSLGLALLSCSHSEPLGIGGITASVERHVVVSPSSATLAVGGTQQLSAQLIQNGTQKKAAFTWSSSDPTVATVSASGFVTAVAPGQARITARASRTQSGTALVTVQAAQVTPPQVVAHLPLGGGPFGSVVASPGVAFITQPSGASLTRLDVAAAAFTGSTSPGPWPAQVSANADGSHIYVPNFFSNAMVTEIDASTLATEATAFATSSPEDAYGITNTPAGDTVIVGITNGPIYRMAMSTGAVVGTIDNVPTAAGYHFEWNAARTRLYASQRAFDGGRVFEIDPNAFTILRTFETGGSAQGIQLSADESQLFVAAQDGGVIVWDIASNAQVGRYDTPGCNGYGLLRTPDNAFLVVGCVLNGLVEVLDPTTGALIETLNVGGAPRELSWDPGTHSIIVPNESGWVDILR